MDKPRSSTKGALSPAAKCGDPVCRHAIQGHHGYGRGGRPGHCTEPGCECRRWQRINLSTPGKRGRKPRVFYKAPELIEAAVVEAAGKPQPSDLHRLILRLGIASLRSELDRLEREL